MTRLLLIILALLCLQTFAPAEEHTATRFTYVDVYIDSKDKPLAAWQLEFSAGASVAIVGIEGGEHPAFKEPPYYDPAAMSHERVILAAFSTARDLPTGRTRVARIHLQITGDVKPRYQAKPTTAAGSDGKAIPVTVSVQEGDAK